MAALASGLAAQPSVVSLSPVVSTGASQTLTFQFSESGGYQQLNVLDVLINNYLDGRQACYVAYVPSANILYLVDDGGDAGGPFAGGMVLNGSGSVSNSQCSISGAGSSATGSGNILTLTLNVSFTSPFGGYKVIYLAARDAANNTGWQTMGVHGVPPLPSSFPLPVSMSPTSGTAENATITFTYQDATSASNLQTVWALINTAIDGRAACYAAYYKPGNQLYLYPDNGDGNAASHITLSGTNTIANSQCTISAQGSSVATNGAQLSVTLNIAFTAAFNGPKGVWMAAQTLNATQTSPWEAIGDWQPTSGPVPSITDFNPKTGPIGTLVTLTGSNLAPAPVVSLAQQGPGTVSAPLTSTSATSLGFTVPAGAASGLVTVTVGSATAISTAQFTVTASTNFTLSASPATASLIQGQSVSYSVQLASGNGFNQLAALSVSGLPTGVTAAFKPSSITSGKTSILTLTAPAGQPVGTSPLVISAAAAVDGMNVTQTGNVSVNVQAPTTSFLGRTVVADSLETPLTGVTATMLGKDGNGNTTGCTGGAVSDSAGNFTLTNLPASCVGPQLIGFNGTTVTTPAGKYAGVNLVFTFVSGQVTTSPVLVHLPRIDTAETFYVQQNAATDQSYSYTTIPGLSVTVYKGTTFTQADGTQPNPFPLAAVQVPVDRLPDLKPPAPTMLSAFIVAFQPANAVTNQPVAVTYPNTVNTAPGVDMALMTLDPTHGSMVPYGTGAVSTNGTQIVPDADPAHPGHLYGLVHFDWHGAMAPAPANGVNPSPAGGGTCGGTGGSGGGPGKCCGCNTLPTLGTNLTGGDPVDLSSGLLVLQSTDLTVNGSRGSLAVQRVYRTLTSNAGNFGIGSEQLYNYFLDTAQPQSVQAINLTAPDGSQFLFSIQPDGTFVNSSVDWLRGAVFRVISPGVAELRYKDGSVQGFQAVPNSIISALTYLRDTNGNQINITRNGRLVTAVTDPVGRQLTFTYNGTNITSITDPIGRTVNYTYNPSNTLATVTDPQGGVTQYFYDSQNRMTSMIDARGVTVFQNTFDSNGRVIQQVAADGGTTTFSFTLANALIPASPVLSTTVTDPRGNTWTYRFNTQGYSVQATDPLGQTMTFTRDPGNNLLLSAQGNAVCPTCGAPGDGNFAFTYDANGNMLTRTDALGNTTTFTYEPNFNQVSSITDPLGNVTLFAYDANGNLISSTDANQHTTAFAYNTNGLVTKITDPLNQSTALAYDSLGNLSTVTDALNNTTAFLYDGVSRRVIVKDALGRVSQTAYDNLDRVVSQTDPVNGVVAFSYDAVGNLLTLTDQKNNKTTFAYDSLSRLKTRSAPAGETDTRSYDVDGNLTAFTDRRGQTSTFAYDALDRLTGETYPDATVARSYDSQSRLNRVTDSQGGTYEYTYDAAGRLISSFAPTGSINYGRDALGRTVSRRVVGQASVTYAYDPAGNLLSANSALASVTRSFDARNFPITFSRSNGVSSAFTYDVLGRVSAISHTQGGTSLNSQTYTYDPVGNRATGVNNIAQSLITQAAASTVDTENHLLTLGSTTYSYDANGNRLSQTSSGVTTSYVWDGRNRLQSITLGSGQVSSFRYDFAGNMISETTSSGVQSYLVDQLTNVVALTDTSGNTSLVLTGQGIDSHWATVTASGSALFGLGDPLNSTVATTDQTGAVAGEVFYEPYGETTASGSFPFLYTGRVLIANGIYYYRARFYDAGANRFLSEDPIGQLIGVNLYRYAENSPVNAVDPTGLIVWSEVAAGAFDVFEGAVKVGEALTKSAVAVEAAEVIVPIAAVLLLPVEAPAALALGTVAGVATAGYFGWRALSGGWKLGSGLQEIWKGFTSCEAEAEPLWKQGKGLLQDAFGVKDKAGLVKFGIEASLDIWKTYDSIHRR